MHLTLGIRKALSIALIVAPSMATAGDFSGPYFGIEAGPRIDFSADTVPFSPMHSASSSRGAVVGAFGGWAFRSGDIVYGVEVGAELRDAAAATDPSARNPWMGRGSRFSTYSAATGYAKVRAGYLFGETLVFTAAGIGVTSVRGLYDVIPNAPGMSPVTERFSDIRRALLFDVGAEREVWDGVSARATYSFAQAATATTVISRSPLRNRHDEHSFKAGIVVRLQ